MREKIQILYCYDKEGKEVYYTNTVKDELYYCIDCGAELIVREGRVNSKHLAHKNTDNCSGTGESVIHKHWKENLFKEGMTINVANSLIKGIKECNVEILKVLNEVSLKKRYNTDWDRDIIVDILLETPKGDIVVEINYKNKKDWNELSKYYDTIDIFKIYEVTVGEKLTDRLKWFGLGEKEEAESKYIQKMIDSKKYQKINVYLNRDNELLGGRDLNSLKCLRESNNGELKVTFLKFHEITLKMKFSEIKKIFEVQDGIRKYSLLVEKDSIGGDNGYNVISILNKADIVCDDISMLKTYDMQYNHRKINNK